MILVILPQSLAFQWPWPMLTRGWVHFHEGRTCYGCMHTGATTARRIVVVRRRRRRRRQLTPPNGAERYQGQRRATRRAGLPRLASACRCKQPTPHAELGRLLHCHRQLSKHERFLMRTEARGCACHVGSHWHCHGIQKGFCIPWHCHSIWAMAMLAPLAGRHWHCPGAPTWGPHSM